MSSLKLEVTNLSLQVEKSCIEGVNFESTMEHFECLKEHQETQIEKARAIIIQKQCKLILLRIFKT